jgi:hypothetical protein
MRVAARSSRPASADKPNKAKLIKDFTDAEVRYSAIGSVATISMPKPASPT